MTKTTEVEWADWINAMADKASIGQDIAGLYSYLRTKATNEKNDIIIDLLNKVYIELATHTEGDTYANFN